MAGTALLGAVGSALRVLKNFFTSRSLTSTATPSSGVSSSGLPVGIVSNLRLPPVRSFIWVANRSTSQSWSSTIDLVSASIRALSLPGSDERAGGRRICLAEAGP